MLLLLLSYFLILLLLLLLYFLILIFLLFIYLGHSSGQSHEAISDTVYATPDLEKEEKDND